MRTVSQTRGGWAGVVVVWSMVFAGSAAVVGLAYAGVDDWLGDTSQLAVYGALGMVLAAGVLGSLLVQLAIRRPPGFVVRTSSSIAGSAAAVAIAALAVTPVALA